MSRKYFGTDGIRGRVGTPPITPDFVLKLGWAVGRVLAASDHSKVLIGKDTRISGYMFESALQAGLSAAGVNILLLGPMPTPAIAYLTRTLRAQAGIVISASHNPYYDNGIKFFSSRGAKLPDETERAIEDMLDQPMVTCESADLGRAERVVDAAGRYIEFCKSTVSSGMEFKDLRIVVDCANGATYHVAPNVFSELGAEVIRIGSAPDGLNINAGCGALHPQAIQTAVLEHEADLGIALDGDGDRLIMVDHKGEVIDGDEILYIIACGRQQAGVAQDTIVGTVMSNLGLEHALATAGMRFRRAQVGDRYVMEMLEQGGWTLGGESSGHIICLDRTSTGDGIVSALQVLESMVRSGCTLHELKSGITKYPQHMVNVPLAEGYDHRASTGFMDALHAAECELGDGGRILVRPSGTEPLLRIMVEGVDAKLVKSLAHRLAELVEAEQRLRVVGGSVVRD
ncbi:MAG: phosphoglucosamine mutase [Gammaproteobacteria bacterium]|jgi:phosphoglucosamine mutase|nr:phosphoglucosamine mutase [Gammaproteobacteria bacterium]